MFVTHNPMDALVFGDRLRVVLDSRPPRVAEVTRRAVESMGLRPGRAVVAAFNASEVRTYG